MSAVRILFAVSALALPGAARAAADGDGAIVVTGRGLAETPAAPVYDRQVIDRAALLRAASGRIEDGLAEVAGFQQFRRSDSRAANPTAQGVTLRALGGNAASRALVLLDGVPMVDPFFGHVPLSALAPERLAQARITRGGGTGAFGAGAVAGTIALDSAGPDQLGQLSASVLGSGRGDSELSASLAPRLGSGFAVASVRWDRGSGFWTTPATQRSAASAKAAYAGWSAALRGVAPLVPGLELQARVMAFGDARTLRFKGADSRVAGQDASLRLIGGGAWPFELLGYVQARDFSNVVVSATSLRKTLDQRATPALGWGGKAELRPPLGAGQVLRLGVDLRGASGTLYEDVYSAVSGLVTTRRSAGGRTGDLGLYAEHDWTRGALTLTGGVRADRWTIAGGTLRETTAAGAITSDLRFVDRAGWAASVRGGARLVALDRLTLRAAVYSGLRQPTLNELYRPFTVVSSSGGRNVVVSTAYNPALGNERLRGVEGGFDLRPAPGITLALTAFDNRLADAIANVTLSTVTTPTSVQVARQRLNIDAVRARGIEASLSARRGRITFDAALALTAARVEASGIAAPLDGKRPAQTPRLAASAALGWQPWPGWDLSLRLRHTGAQFEDDLEVDGLPAATTLDAFASVPLGHGASLVLRGENLFDAQVITRNQAGSLDLGTPRTLWAGLRVFIGH